MGKVFSVEYPILFSHCDPAGIVYFPRFFDLLHRAMEDWFTFGLGGAVRGLHHAQAHGHSDGRNEGRFREPGTLGDMLRIELRVLKLGSASIELGIDSFVDGAPCFKARHTVCVFSQDTYKAIPVPDDLRDRMAAYVAAD